MNYFEFSFRENEISAAKLCMATAGPASDDQEAAGSYLIEFLNIKYKMNKRISFMGSWKKAT